MLMKLLLFRDKLVSFLYLVSPILEPYFNLIRLQLQLFGHQIPFVGCDILLLLEQLFKLINLPLREENARFFCFSLLIVYCQNEIIVLLVVDDR